jgi:sigma-B regulation protein RsbU (phosphoserine phosphatase)
MPLGLFEGAPLEEETVTMEPGDFVVTFSDGVSEAMNAEEEEFEDARILKSIEGSSGRDAQSKLEHPFSSVKTFTAGAAQNDDVTVLVVSYRGVDTE